MPPRPYAQSGNTILGSMGGAEDNTTRSKYIEKPVTLLVLPFVVYAEGIF